MSGNLKSELLQFSHSRIYVFCVIIRITHDRKDYINNIYSLKNDKTGRQWNLREIPSLTEENAVDCTAWGMPSKRSPLRSGGNPIYSVKKHESLSLSDVVIFRLEQAWSRIYA